MLDLSGGGLRWNLYLGIQVAAAFLWDQKWGVLIGITAGCLLGYNLHD